MPQYSFHPDLVTDKQFIITDRKVWSEFMCKNLQVIYLLANENYIYTNSLTNLHSVQGYDIAALHGEPFYSRKSSVLHAAW